MRHRVRLPFHLHFEHDQTDSFFGYIQQDDDILMDVLGVNSDGTVDAFALRPVPALKIEKDRVYCFAADLKSFSTY